MYSWRVFARASILQTKLLRQSKKYCFIQARCFTGYFLPWYSTAQLRRVVSKDALLPLIIPCAFSSATVKSLAKNIAAIKTAEDYLFLYENFKDSSAMTQVNRITILHYLARFATEGPKKNFFLTKRALKKQKDIFAILLQSIAAELERCKERELASIMWSLGKLKEHVSLIVSECEKEIFRRDVTSFKAPSVCQLLNGFASLDLKRSQFFSLIEKSILEGKLKISDFENRGLAGVMWSFSKTGNGSRELFEKFEKEILSRNVKNFTSAQLVQFLWSFTQKEIQCDKLFEITAQEILERPVADLSDYSINMLLSLFAKAGPDQHKEQGKLFNCLGAEVRQRGVHGFDTKELSMLVWSFAKGCPNTESVFDIVEKELHIRGISRLTNEELSLILWSFAESGNLSATLFNACQEEILSRDVSLFKPHQLSQVIWAFGMAFGMATVPSLGFFSIAEKEVLSNASHFSDKELCMILHGFSHSSAGTHKLFTKLEREVLERNILGNNPGIIPELASAFSECNYKATLTFDTMEKVLKATDQSVFSEQELQEIKMAFFKVGRQYCPLQNANMHT